MSRLKRIAGLAKNVVVMPVKMVWGTVKRYKLLSALMLTVLILYSIRGSASWWEGLALWVVVLMWVTAEGKRGFEHGMGAAKAMLELGGSRNPFKSLSLFGDEIDDEIDDEVDGKRGLGEGSR